MNNKSLRLTPLLILFACSGAAALIYEILWLKELGRLFGVTAYAAASTLAAFFMGISGGSWYWGRRVSRMSNALRIYAYLELGVAFSALLYFLLYDVYVGLYPTLAGGVGGGPLGLLGIKFTLALVLLVPPAFFMGGTLPVMGQHLVRRQDELGARISLLYLVNTLGAAAGVLLAGFVLPPQLGFTRTYLVAISTTVLVALLALYLSRCATNEATLPPPAARRLNALAAHSLSRSSLFVLAGLSGLLTLALEVLWTRMFEQVLQNSVYTFAAVLAVFLLALALGSATANRLCMLTARGERIVIVLLALAGLLVAFTPRLFYVLTGGLQEMGKGLSWGAYLVQVFGQTSALLLLPTLAIGTLFPYVMKLAEALSEQPGAIVGRLASVNSLAAILGSLLAGFVLLPLLGLWNSIQVIALIYVVGALWIAWNTRAPYLIGATLCACGIIVALLSSHKLQTVALDHSKSERLLASYEGSHGTVSVIQRDTDIRLKENNGHLVGTSQSALNVRLQSWIPLCAQGNARAVFYLGMGTGITAGGALDFPVDRVVVTELNPRIVQADREWFAPFTNGLFSSPRVQIIQDDGRNNLLANPARYDLIIADIFLTHHAGIANLYSLEHYQTVQARLTAGGMFCQWLPLFEMSEDEFFIVARTMLEVFPHVSLWRRGFSPSFPVYGLLGSREVLDLGNESWARSVAELDSATGLTERIWFQVIPYAAYVADLTGLKRELSGYPLNTDDLPVIEYLAPLVERNRLSRAGQSVLAWKDLGEFLNEIAVRCPLERDTNLRNVSPAQQRQVAAGRAYYHYTVCQNLNETQEAAKYLAEYESWVSDSLSGSRGAER
jgi:spermidine synthase